MSVYLKWWSWCLCRKRATCSRLLGQDALTVRSHPNGFFDSQPNMCRGCFGCGLRRVSKKDERLAALRSDVEPIRGVHAQHTYWRYVADFPHVRCSLRLTVCQPSRRNCASGDAVDSMGAISRL